MHRQSHISLVLVCLLTPAISTSAQDDNEPVMTIAVRSLHGFGSKIGVVMKPFSAPRKSEGSASLLDKTFKKRFGLKLDRLAGIDLERPCGLYLMVNESTAELGAVILMPVKDDNTFAAAELGARLFSRPKRNRENAADTAVAARIASRYLYASLEAWAIEGRLLPDPGRILSGSDTDDLVVVLKPGGAKQRILKAVRSRFSSSEPVVGAVVAKFKTLRLAAMLAQQLISGTESASLSLNVDDEAGDVLAALRLLPEKQSDLGELARQMGTKPNRFADLISSRSALSLLCSLPTEPIIERLPPNLVPMFKQCVGSEGLDLIADVRIAEDGKEAGMLIAVTLQDSALADALIRAGASSSRRPIKLDAHKIGDVKVHEMDVKRLPTPATLSPALSAARTSSYPVQIALDGNVMYAAGGRDALKILEQALGKEASRMPGPALGVDFTWKYFNTLMTGKPATSVPDGKTSLIVTGGEQLKATLSLNVNVLAAAIRDWSKSRPVRVPASQ